MGVKPEPPAQVQVVKVPVVDRICPTLNEEFGSYLKLEKGDAEEDMMELIDVLTEQKDEKKWADICVTMRSMGAIAESNESERDSIGDFEGLTVMCEIVRSMLVRCRGLEEFQHLSSFEKVESLADVIQKQCQLQQIQNARGRGKSQTDSATPKLLDENSTSDALSAELAGLGDVEGLSDEEILEKLENLQKELPPVVALCADTTEDQVIAVLDSFCLSMIGVCRKSNLNRGILREENAVELMVSYLDWLLVRAQEVADENSSDNRFTKSVCCAAIGLKAMCYGNDGNKKAAARVAGTFNEEGLMETDCLDTNVPTLKRDSSKKGKAIDILLKCLTLDVPGARFKSDSHVQAHCLWALRVICCDDDGRQSSCVPAGVENRDYLSNRDHFPTTRKFILDSFDSMKDLDSLGALQWYRMEGVLLLLKEVGCAQTRIHQFVLEDNVLPLIRSVLDSPKANDNIVRACLFVLRQFSFSDDMKELFAVDTGTAATVLNVLKRKRREGREKDNAAADKKKREAAEGGEPDAGAVTNSNSNTNGASYAVVSGQAVPVPVIEQAFGLFSNVTLRKPHIAQLLHDEPNRICAVGEWVLGLDYCRDSPSVWKSVLCTMRNVGKQVPEAGTDIAENGFLDRVRDMYFSKKQVVDSLGKGAIEILEKQQQAKEANKSVGAAASTKSANKMAEARRWIGVLDIAKQMLREFRHDEGVRDGAKYNDYY